MKSARTLVGMLVAVGLSTSVLSASVARACTRIEPIAFAIDPALRASDSTPPDPFTALEADVRRMPEETCRNGECISSSCGNSGTAEITFDMPAEATETLGYRIVWLRGSIPPAARQALTSVWPIYARTAGGRGLVGISIGFDEVEDLNAEVALVAVDRAGNESQPSEAVHLEFSGCTIDLRTLECEQPASKQATSEQPASCNLVAVGQDARSHAWLVACALVIAVRRRRRSVRSG